MLPGEFIFHKGDPVATSSAIQSGTAGVYLMNLPARPRYSKPEIISAQGLRRPMGRLSTGFGEGGNGARSDYTAPQ